MVNQLGKGKIRVALRGCVLTLDLHRCLPMDLPRGRLTFALSLATQSGKYIIVGITMEKMEAPKLSSTEDLGLEQCCNSAVRLFVRIIKLALVALLHS